MGHYKRVLEVVSELLKISESYQLYIACQSWQKSKIQISECDRIHYLEDLMEPGICYKSFNDNFFFEKQYLCWEQSIVSLNEFQNADLVISDNLCGVLAHHDNVILMGSFLWMDLLENDKRYQKSALDFVIRENKLLSKYRPKMLCVGDIVMPTVVEKTSAIKLPWFSESVCLNRKPSSYNGDRLSIAVILGRTGVMDFWLSKLIPVLKSRGIHILLPIPYNKIHNVDAFNFLDEEYQGVDFVICRPGIGVLTDCIKNRTPFLSVVEPNNIEMEHNANTMANILKTGSFTLNADVNEICDFVESLYKDQIKLRDIENRLLARKLGGSESAANYISNSLLNN